MNQLQGVRRGEVVKLEQRICLKSWSKDDNSTAARQHFKTTIPFLYNQHERPKTGLNSNSRSYTLLNYLKLLCVIG